MNDIIQNIINMFFAQKRLYDRMHGMSKKPLGYWTWCNECEEVCEKRSKLGCWTNFNDVNVR